MVGLAISEGDEGMFRSVTFQPEANGFGIALAEHR